MAEIEKNIIDNKDITVLRLTGEIDVNQIIDELDRFYEGEFTNNVIWDLSDAEGKNLSSNDLHIIVSHAKELGHLRKNGKTAFIISSSLGYGMGRMYDSFAQVINHPVKHSVFRSYDEAVAWICDTDSD